MIQASLERHDGNQRRVCRELGLKNRHVLYRLVKKYGIDPRGRPEADGEG